MYGQPRQVAIAPSTCWPAVELSGLSASTFNTAALHSW
jgi:hypothetical protein